MTKGQLRAPARHPKSRLLLLLVALAIGIPLAFPSALLGADLQSTQRGSGPTSDALIVHLRPDAAAADVSRLFAFAGASEIGRLDAIGVRVVSVAAANHLGALSMLARDSRVSHVELDLTADAAVVPSDPHWDKEWGSRKIRAPEAWSVTRGERSVVIAIVDTGVDASQPDLRGRVLRGWDFQNDDANPADDDGHGTAVATTAAAAGNDGVGIAGMCWQCRIMPVKVLNGQGHGTHSNIAAGIIYAANHGADVINLSIAGLGASEVMGSAVAYALARGVTVVAAAGNFGSRRTTYPAAYPGVISVAATDESDRLYSWSNRGSWVTLAAPGCAYSGRPHAKWAWLCGTSLATPIVTGTVALMKSVSPRVGRARIISLLTNSGVRTSAAVARGRRLDAGRAVRALETVAAPTRTPTPTPTPRP